MIYQKRGSYLKSSLFNKMLKRCDHCKTCGTKKLYAYKDESKKGYYCEECIEEFKSYNYKWDKLDTYQMVQ